MSFRLQPKEILKNPHKCLSLQRQNCKFPSLTCTINMFKQSLQKIQSTKNRYKVINRCLQKQKSLKKILKKQHKQYEQIQQRSNIDQYMLLWSQIQRQKQLQKQSETIKRQKKRNKMMINKNKKSIQDNKIEIGNKLRKERSINEILIRQNQQRIYLQNSKKKRAEKRQQLKRMKNISKDKQQKIKLVLQNKMSQRMTYHEKALKNQNKLNNYINQTSQLHYKLQQASKPYITYQYSRQIIPLNVENPQNTIR